MTMFLRKRPMPPIGPRHNQWKGLRASSASDQRQQARRGKLVLRWRRALRMGQWAVGLTVLAWGLVMVTQGVGPILQGWLEIREIEVEGIHHVTKAEVLARLALNPGMGLHQADTALLAGRVQAHAWIKEATIERRPLHLLHVSVLERTPAAIIRIGADHWLSDENGYLLVKLGRQDDETLPLLTGLEPQPLQRGEVRVRNAVQSGIVLAKLIANTLDGRVEVDLANFSNVVASANGVRFQFGDDSLVNQWERFRKVNPSFKTAASDDRKRMVSEIDLRYDNRVIVRERV
ncbi:MAG: FtsQ-type POTRA domain-containing protein [Nitrospira sp.]|nr:FtsQ-type POTRA domain-containing protein [Nitrospira sp.]TKB75324.1 MAG: FtsQ-type POTRA domain-containing protein [Nitrospira sp.]